MAGQKIMGHCMRCKDKREILNGVVSKTKKGTFMMKGPCAKCGTTVSRILSSETAKSLGK